MKDVKNTRTNKSLQPWAVLIPAVGIIFAIVIVVVLLFMYQKSNAQVFNDFVKERLVAFHQEQLTNLQSIISEEPDSFDAVVIFYDVEKEKNNFIQHYLISNNGDFVCVKDKKTNETCNILTWMQKNEIAEENLRIVQDALLSGEDTQIISLQKDQAGQYLILSNLGYQDWYLVSYAYSDWLHTYISAIMNHTAALIACLLLFFLLLLFNIWWIYTRQREKTKGCQAQYSLLEQFSDTVLFEYDCQARTLIFTPNITARFNIQVTGALHIFDNNYQFTLVHPDDIPLMKEMFEEVTLMTENQTKILTIRFLNREGEYRWVRWEGKLLNDKSGMPYILIGKISDVHEQQNKEFQLIQKASIDAMTGILNREAAESQIMQQLEVCKKGFLFLIDVDDFKLINDQYGHAAGDRFLIHLAKQLKGSFRLNDIAGRIGGDEFVVFMPETGDSSVARLKAEYLFQQIIQSENAISSVSIGIASYPDDGCTYTELYEAADAAMYKAKHKGKQGYCFMREMQQDLDNIQNSGVNL